MWSQLDKQWIHGHSYGRTIEASVPEPLRDRIHLRGQLSRGTVKSAYQRAHVLAMPSVCIPFGLPLAEAMASGLPCVASRTDGIPDILLDNVTGLLVERGSVAALTDALRRLSQDSGLREQMGRTARQRAEEVFDWSVPAARLESLYRQQLAAGPFTLEESRAAARPVT